VQEGNYDRTGAIPSREPPMERLAHAPPRQGTSALFRAVLYSKVIARAYQGPHAFNSGLRPELYDVALFGLPCMRRSRSLVCSPGARL